MRVDGVPAQPEELTAAHAGVGGQPERGMLAAVYDQVEERFELVRGPDPIGPASVASLFGRVGRGGGVVAQ